MSVGPELLFREVFFGVGAFELEDGFESVGEGGDVFGGVDTCLECASFGACEALSLCRAKGGSSSRRGAAHDLYAS
tara:strand:+ start:240 stop:467 length:228 start_codon:yes stop_codon:yes gene_type:complete